MAWIKMLRVIYICISSYERVGKNITEMKEL